MPNCYNPQCKKFAIKLRPRGLCSRCYPKFSTLVAKRRLSWAFLERQGVCMKIRPRSPSVEDQIAQLVAEYQLDRSDLPVRS